MNWHHLFFSLNGRIGRATFWWAVAAITFVWTAIAAISVFVLSGPASSIAPEIGFLAIAYGYLAASVKRLHDRNWSGWWLLPVFGPPVFIITGIQFFGLDLRTPFLGQVLDLLTLPCILMFIVLFFLPGSPGANDYGPKPRRSNYREV
jgi:uncharacterized membrane protein YhaH (DUF805 family)